MRYPFTSFPGWIRKHMRFEAFGALNLVSDSMEACEEIMLGGEVHFLLFTTPRRADAFDAERFPSVHVGEDVIPVCA